MAIKMERDIFSNKSAIHKITLLLEILHVYGWLNTTRIDGERNEPFYMHWRIWLKMKNASSTNHTPYRLFSETETCTGHQEHHVHHTPSQTAAPRGTHARSCSASSPQQWWEMNRRPRRNYCGLRISVTVLNYTLKDIRFGLSLTLADNAVKTHRPC